MDKLNERDCTILIEALDAWIDKLLPAKMYKELAEAIKIKTNNSITEEKQMEMVNNSFNAIDREYASKREGRVEIARLLQAKIILLKDSIQTENLTKG